MNGECDTTAPVEMTWFADTDLIVETPYQKITFNSARETPIVAGVYVIRPLTPEKHLTPIEGLTLRLVKNNVAQYLVVGDKYAYRLPFEVLTNP